MSRNFEAVFFDMDGTFVNSEPHWLAAETSLMAEYGHEWTHEDQRYCLGGPLSKVGQYMYELAGKVESPEFFHHELVRRTVEHFQSHIEYMPGALELLLQLKEEGIPVGLVTASPSSMMSATLSRLPEEYFDVAVSGDDVKVTKPDPEGYILAAERLGVDISHSIILEDSLTGISAAVSSGAFVVAVPMMVTVTEKPRQKIVHSLVDVSVDTLEDFYNSVLTGESI